MKKVRLFVCGDMTVIDTGASPVKNFLSTSYNEVVAIVVSIEKRVISFADGDIWVKYDIKTDYRNPYRTHNSIFTLTEENFAKVGWVE